MDSGFTRELFDSFSPLSVCTICIMRLVDSSHVHCSFSTKHILTNVFPTIRQQWSAGPIKEILLRSFVEEPIFLALHIETLSNHMLIRQIVSSLSHYSIDVAILALCVNDPNIERVSPGWFCLHFTVWHSRGSQDPETLSSILSSLSLWGFSVLFSKDTPKGSYVDRRTDLAKIWSSRCPTLDRVEFPDGTTYSKINGSWPQWVSRGT
jgi:hypothetical protein